MLRPVQVRRAPHLRQLLSARSTEPGRTMAPYSRKSPWPDQTGVVTRREPEWRAMRHVRGFRAVAPCLGSARGLDQPAALLFLQVLKLYSPHRTRA